MMNELFIKDYESDPFDQDSLELQLESYSKKPLDRGLESTREVKKITKETKKVTKEEKYNSTREFLLSLEKGDVIMNNKREILVFDEIVEQKEDGEISFTCDKPLCKNEDRIIYSHKILDDKLKYFRVSDEIYKEHINGLNDMSKMKIEGTTHDRSLEGYVTSPELSDVQCHICNGFMQYRTLDYVRGHLHKLEGTEYEGLVACWRCQKTEFVDLYKGKGGRLKDKEDSICYGEEVSATKKPTENKVKDAKKDKVKEEGAKRKSSRVTKKDLEEMVKDKDKVIDELRSKLEAKDKVVKELNDKLEAKDKVIKELNAKLEATDKIVKELKELKDKVNNKETSADKLNNLLDKKSKSGFRFEIVKY